MLGIEIKAKVMKDLGVKEHRARRYTELFFKKYTGQKAAITAVYASYTDDGEVKITYVINNKKKHIVIDEKSIYSNIIEKAKERKQKLNQ